jgi:uncharacterized membrane protein YjfL (UPF0719 family)
MEQAVHNGLLSIGFAILGFVLLYAGYRAFDALTPGNLNKQIFEERNMAAAVLAAAFVVGVALVVHAAIT